MMKAYRQVPIDAASSRLLSYVSVFGQFEPHSLPEGIRPACHIFQAIMDQIFHDFILLGWLFVYFDNIWCGADSDDQLNVDEFYARSSRISVCLSKKLIKRMNKISCVTNFLFIASKFKFNKFKSKWIRSIRLQVIAAHTYDTIYNIYIAHTYVYIVFPSL